MAEAPTPRPSLGLLVWPLLILAIVALLTLPRVAGAFNRYQPTPVVTPAAGGVGEPGGERVGTPIEVTTPTAGVPLVSTQTTGGAAEGTVIPQATNGLTALPTNVRSEDLATGTVVPLAPSATTVPPAATETIAPAAATDTVAPPAAPTYTAVPAPTQALPPAIGNSTQGLLRQVEVGGQKFRVEATEVVQDWQFSDQPGVASWITDTVFNYIVGLPYTPGNTALFNSLKADDSVRLTVASGDVLQFRLSAVRRISTTDTRLLGQDHVGLTLLLLGEPGNERSVALGAYAPQATLP